MLARLQRKLNEVRRYPALGAAAADRRDLAALALWRTRLLGPGTAAWLARGRNPVLTPRLRATRGEPVRVTIGDYGEMDCFDELFIDGIYDLASVPFAPDLAVDCGAFRGYFTALAVGAFPAAAFACFEPNPAHQASLQAQLALLSRPVELVPAAVGPADGTATFAGEGIGGALTDGPAGAGACVVPVVDFARWLDARRPQRLVWKLDVEGAESTLLPATLSHLPASTALFLETHYDDAHCEKLLAPYRAAGFVVHEVRRRPARGFSYVEWRLLRHSPA